MSEPTPLTTLLSESARGDGAATQQLYARLLPEVKRVARMRLAQSGAAAGLNTTAVVHEGFVRMAEQQGLAGATRGQFFAHVGRVLRKVVIEQLSGGATAGDPARVTLSVGGGAAQAEAVDLIALDQALARLQRIDAGLYELLEMIGFAGLTITEVAELRGAASQVVNRDLLKAQALLQELMR
jgi:RNA polymerase sigma factor (TIGR02999 family)